MKKKVLIACTLAAFVTTTMADTIEWDPNTRQWVKRDDHGNIVLIVPGQAPNIPDILNHSSSAQSSVTGGSSPKQTMHKSLLVACALAGFAGCATTSTTTTQPKLPQYKEVQIISEPAGVRIEVNDDYVGDAPITIRVRQSGDGYFEDFTSTRIRAIPTQAGDYTQTKVFYGAFGGGLSFDKIPSRIFFDMHLGPALATTSGRMPRISTDAEYYDLPHGTEFVWIPTEEVYLRP